jgi:hypothetical protein
MPEDPRKHLSITEPARRILNVIKAKFALRSQSDAIALACSFMDVMDRMEPEKVTLFVGKWIRTQTEEEK